MLGEKTIELWWNSGVGKPPFDRMEGGIIEIGLASLHAVSNNINYTYFLGNDRKVYKLRDATIEPVTNKALAREFQGYSTVDDAILWCMDLNDTNLVVVTFPTANKTWVYIEGGQWFEWSSGINGGRNKSNSYVKAYGKHLVEDYQNGNLYELDFDTYTENSEPIIRIRDTAPIDSGLFGSYGKRVTINKFILNIEVGVGLLSGQGSNPQIMLSYSDDGGKSFSNEMWGTVGKLGEFQYKVEWNGLGSFFNRIIRIKTSDPVYYAIRGADADIEVGI